MDAEGIKWEFEKAVPLNDCHAVVYAMQFTEENFPFQELPPELGGGKFFIFELYGNIIPFLPNSWLVWFPKTIEFTDMTDNDFREKYTLYKDLPQNVKEIADKHPSYEKWKNNISMAHDLPRQ